MLPTKLTFLDIETTGLSPTHDRVIEIGVVRVDEGKVKDEFESLVDPGIHLPPEISVLTGISSSHLESAPTFRNIKEKLDELVQDSVVVAHNARFDVSFMKAEYERVGGRFKNKSFCTAKLSRMMFPRFRRHGLDSIIDRFGFVCEPRHRALPDAKVLWDFYKLLLKRVDNKKLVFAIKKLLKKPSLPAGIKFELVDKLPKSHGVYIFYGETGSPLYVGKSVNIHDRVMSHFNSTHKSGRELSISQQITHIEHEETDGELASLLREKALIWETQPVYNRQLRLLEKMAILKHKKCGEYDSLELVESSEIGESELDKVLGIFRTKGKAKDTLLQLADEFTLCHKLLGLENGKGACFRSQIEKCKGACTQAEHPLKYNMRFAEAFTKFKIKQWPFAGPILIKEGKKAHLVNKWCYLGIYNENEKEDLIEKSKRFQFDWDTYKILLKFIMKPEYSKKIRIL